MLQYFDDNIAFACIRPTSRIMCTLGSDSTGGAERGVGFYDTIPEEIGLRCCSDVVCDPSSLDQAGRPNDLSFETDKKNHMCKGVKTFNTWNYLLTINSMVEVFHNARQRG